MARLDDRLLGTPQTAQEGTDGILRSQQVRDQFKRLLIRFERLQHRHHGMKLMAYRLINLRAFCGI